MSDAEQKPDVRIEELLDLFHRDGGVFAVLRDIKAELYALNERAAKDAKTAAEDARRESEALRRLLDERVAHLGPALLDLQEAIKKASDDAERKTQETLGKIAGALQSHGDTLDRLTTFVRESAERDAKARAEANAALEKRLAALEEVFRQSLQKMQDAAAKDAQDMRETLARNAAAAEKQVKALAAETLTLKAHFETFSEGQRAMVEYFNAQKKRDEDAAARARAEAAREANNRGAALYHKAAFEAAAEEFRKAAELDPKMAEAASNLGLALSRLKRNKEAVEAFKRALALDANLGEAYHNLGVLYHLNAEYAKAVDMFKASIEKSAEPSIAYLNLGTSYHESGKLKEAAAAWEKALELDPANEDARRALALLRKEKA